MKSDRRIVLLCIVVLIAIGIAYYALDSSVEMPTVNVATDTTSVKRGSGYYHGQGGRGYARGGNHGHAGHRSTSGEPYSAYETKAPARFSFNPNTADSTALLSLGLPPWMVRGIYKYRAKGGVYRTPEDFARIPGLTQQLYLELKPYLVFGDETKMAADMVGPRSIEESPRQKRDSVAYPVKLQSGEYLSVNSADTTDLKRIPGVGSYYAKKIADYRDRLGGFVSLDQLREIKGVPDTAADYLSISGEVRKIAINKLTLNQLRSHPYVGYYRAKAITDYRRLKGNITSLQQLSLLPDFSQEDIKRLEPYVEY